MVSFNAFQGTLRGGMAESLEGKILCAGDSDGALFVSVTNCLTKTSGRTPMLRYATIDVPPDLRLRDLELDCAIYYTHV